MRCRCCDRPDSNYVDRWEDWYCTTCEQVIRKASGEEFTLDDLYDIIEGEEEVMEGVLR